MLIFALILFQFTRPQGARQLCYTSGVVRFSFNSRARKGRDWTYCQSNCQSDCFNSRARKGRDVMSAMTTPCPRCFNSRARKGRDLGDGFLYQVCRVSIHAPARGATAGRSAYVLSPYVSIHAPARGATPTHMPSTRQVRRFNSRARKGRDSATTGISFQQVLFQFTRPQGARHRRATNRAFSSSFNSRARKGRDFRQAGHLPQGTVSIHAPARGATIVAGHITETLDVSIHAPARGATDRRATNRTLSSGFNSRARKGRDVGSLLDELGLKVSIHAPARGATVVDIVGNRSQLVSIHAPARGATVVRLPSNRFRMFQFTRPQGARHRRATNRTLSSSFNSRARKGRDFNDA